MNKQILKLAKQSGLKATTETVLSPAEQRFAELIVNECAELFKNVYVTIEGEEGPAIVIARKEIKRHFGIDE